MGKAEFKQMFFLLIIFQGKSDLAFCMNHLPSMKCQALFARKEVHKFNKSQ